MSKLNLVNQQIPTKCCLYSLTGKETSTGSDWIYKTGGKNASFKRRWCVLKGNLFYYYVNQQDVSPKGYWDLKDCELGRIKEKETSTRFRWKVSLKEDKGEKEDRILYVENSEKREKWLNLFLAAKAANLNLELLVQRNRTASFINPVKKDTPADGPAPKRPAQGPDLAKIPPKKSEQAPETNPQQDTNSFLSQGELTPEITELVSPRPFTNCYLSSKVYDDKNIEKQRNQEVLKSGRTLGLEEEWDETETDWLSDADEIDYEEGCSIM